MEFKPISENRIFRTALKPFSQLDGQKTKFQSYRKEPLAELKFAIFKNWLDTRPKMETHEPNVYPTILGGVSRGFWSPFLDLDARSAI